MSDESSPAPRKTELVETTYYVAEGCLRCAACSSIAPGIVAMGETAAVFVRQPSTADDHTAVEVALFNCPMLAIRKRSKALGEGAS